MANTEETEKPDKLSALEDYMRAHAKAELRVAKLERHLSHIVLAASDVLQATPDNLLERLRVLSDAVAEYDDET